MEHRSHLTRPLSAIALIFFELAACDGPSSSSSSGSTNADGGTSPGISSGSGSSGLRGHEQCVRSVCDTCLDDAPAQGERCHSCLQICTGAFATIPCTTCTQFCDGSACDAACSGTPACLEYTVVFQPTGVADPTVESACHALTDSNASCGQPVDSADLGCERLGRVYDRATATSAFRCLEELPCDATVAAAYACFPRPRHGLAEWYCRETARNGVTTCDASVRDRVARYDGWVLASVATELQKCGSFEAVGVTFEDCVDSWLFSVDLFRFY